MKDNRYRYVDAWFEDRTNKYRARRKLRHFERDFQRVNAY